jgi:hypothetical protein
MPIVETVIAKEISTFMKAKAGDTLTPEASKQMDDFANSLAGVIANAIKSATVTVSAGIPVTTAGSPTAQTGATTGPGTGTLS